jgi:hypothetical protein
MNCCLVAYFLDAADLPVISQVISSAKMLVTYPVPSAQERKASVTISRLDLTLVPSFLAAGTPTPPAYGCGSAARQATITEAATAHRVRALEQLGPGGLTGRPGDDAEAGT